MIRKKSKPPQITSVTYRTNKQVAPYIHEHLEATATVQPGEDPVDVAERLSVWVHETLGVQCTRR